MDEVQIYLFNKKKSHLFEQVMAAIEKAKGVEPGDFVNIMENNMRPAERMKFFRWCQNQYNRIEASGLGLPRPEASDTDEGE